jgi:hypothetical protein
MKTIKDPLLDLNIALERVRAWGGDTTRFVNQGMAGDEYGDYLARAGQPGIAADGRVGRRVAPPSRPAAEWPYRWTAGNS